ncbi:MAG: glycoside hydrolase family 13 protein [Oscillospiraceae bacterium]|jgi:glycosidase|nr:glycoside hydrolase family 13 protein [Oscillospiraceae bacterium]
MGHIPFQSRKGYHKEPFGAAQRGTELVFRIVVPREWTCTGAQLLVWRDDVGADAPAPLQSLPMTWERMEGTGEEWWRASVRLDAVGLYWYRFSCDLAQGAWSIGAGESGLGVWGGENAFPLTVYHDEYAEPDWLCGGVIYQIFPDRFFSSGKPKPGVPEDRISRTDWGGEPLTEPIRKPNAPENYDFFGGDLCGIAQKLPYLQSLGVTCIYLNPIFEANSNHRYDTADYSKIDPLLGTEDDFRKLCSAAKSHGIAVILDGVFSHTGADSVYFNRSGRYGTGGAFRDPNSPYRTWYKFDEYPHKYRSWWGVDILPELREEEPGYLDFVTGLPEGTQCNVPSCGIARRWLRAGASGWRLDVADELPDVFLDAFAAAVKAEKPDAYILGEVWEDASEKISYGARRRYLQGGQLDSVMNYPLADAIMDFARGGKAEKLADTIETLQEHYPPRALHLAMNHIGTHDTVRAMALLGGAETDGRKAVTLTQQQRQVAIARIKIAAVLQYTLPGIPCVYYGDEAGLEGGRDPYNRACFPWGNENRELQTHYRMLGKLRREHELFRAAPCKILSAQGGKISFERTGADETLYVHIDAEKNVTQLTINHEQLTL